MSPADMIDDPAQPALPSWSRATLAKRAPDLPDGCGKLALDLFGRDTQPRGDVAVVGIIDPYGEIYLALAVRHAPQRAVHALDPFFSAHPPGHHPASGAKASRKSAALLAALAAPKIAFSSSRSTASQLPM